MLGLILDKDTRPSDPNRLHYLMTLLKSEQVVVEDAFGVLDFELARLGVLLDDDWQFERDYD